MAHARPGDPVIDRPQHSPSDDSSAARPGLRRALVVVTVLGLVIAVVGAVVGLLAPRIGGEDDERDAVVDAATSFATTYNTYDVADKDDYQQRMKRWLTPSYYTQFTKVTDAVFSAISSKKQKSGDAKVLGVAVSSIDDDSAVALVAVNATITSTTEAEVIRRFRWQVTLSHDGGTWRVSQFESVDPAQASVDDGSTPSPTPSSSSSSGDQ